MCLHRRKSVTEQSQSLAADLLRSKSHLEATKKSRADIIESTQALIEEKDAIVMQLEMEELALAEKLKRVRENLENARQAKVDVQLSGLQAVEKYSRRIEKLIELSTTYVEKMEVCETSGHILAEFDNYVRCLAGLAVPLIGNVGYGGIGGSQALSEQSAHCPSVISQITKIVGKALRTSVCSDIQKCILRRRSLIEGLELCAHLLVQHCISCSNDSIASQSVALPFDQDTNQISNFTEDAFQNHRVQTFLVQIPGHGAYPVMLPGSFPMSSSPAYAPMVASLYGGINEAMLGQQTAGASMPGGQYLLAYPTGFPGQGEMFPGQAMGMMPFQFLSAPWIGQQSPFQGPSPFGQVDNIETPDARGVRANVSGDTIVRNGSEFVDIRAACAASVHTIAALVEACRGCATHPYIPRIPIVMNTGSTQPSIGSDLTKQITNGNAGNEKAKSSAIGKPVGTTIVLCDTRTVKHLVPSRMPERSMRIVRIMAKLLRLQKTLGQSQSVPTNNDTGAGTGVGTPLRGNVSRSMNIDGQEANVAVPSESIKRKFNDFEVDLHNNEESHSKIRKGDTGSITPGFEGPSIVDGSEESVAIPVANHSDVEVDEYACEAQDNLSDDLEREPISDSGPAANRNVNRVRSKAQLPTGHLRCLLLDETLGLPSAFWDCVRLAHADSYINFLQEKCEQSVDAEVQQGDHEESCVCRPLKNFGVDVSTASVNESWDSEYDSEASDDQQRTSSMASSTTAVCGEGGPRRANRSIGASSSGPRNGFIVTCAPCSKPAGLRYTDTRIH